MDRLEALVCCVRVPAHSQQVDVPVPDPGHLQQHLEREEKRGIVKCNLLIRENESNSILSLRLSKINANKLH